MYPFFDELSALFKTKLINIDDNITEYHNSLIYELITLETSQNVSKSMNYYNVEINLFYISKITDKTHSNEALKILKKLETNNAKTIKKMEKTNIIIDADEYNVTKFDLEFEKFNPHSLI